MEGSQGANLIEMSLFSLDAGPLSLLSEKKRVIKIKLGCL